MITRIRLEAFRGFRSCDVELGELTVITGVNGSGKTSFLEALAFLGDATRSSIQTATVKPNKGFSSFRNRSANSNPKITVWFRDGNVSGELGVSFAIQYPYKTMEGIEEEYLKMSTGDSYNFTAPLMGPYTMMSTNPLLNQPPEFGKLALTIARELPEFAPAFRALSTIFSFEPDLNSITSGAPMREVGKSEYLMPRSGEELAPVIFHRLNQDSVLQSRVMAYLGQIVPSLHGFKQYFTGYSGLYIGGDTGTGVVPLEALSTGTLETIFLLLWLFDWHGEKRTLLFDQPDAHLHPGAVPALLDAMRAATTHDQVILTTHSPYLLDSLDLSDDEVKLLAVDANNESARIGTVKPEKLSVVKDALFSLGELHVSGDLEPVDTSEDLAL